MAICNLNNGKTIGDFKKPYIVAEVNTSHNGDINIAREMIKSAKETGCSCVKFQSWSTESLYAKSYYNSNPIAKRFISKFSFSEEQLLEVYEYSKEIGIDFASTPYSKKEVDFLLEKCNVPYIKVASMDLTNHSFLEYIAKTGAPIVLATGMGYLNEIIKAVDIIKSSGNKNLCILHCISVYPADVYTIRLKNILKFRDQFPSCAIGFSDHSLGTEIASASVVLGVAMIEKHFTLDNKKIGFDNQMATEPEEMKHLVQNCCNVYNSLGGEDRVLLEDEIEQRKKMRRSIVSTKNLKIGDILKLEDMDVKRPGTGIPPERLIDLVGKVVIKDIDDDTIIEETDIKELD